MLFEYFYVLFNMQWKERKLSTPNLFLPAYYSVGVARTKQPHAFERADKALSQ